MIRSAQCGTDVPGENICRITVEFKNLSDEPKWFIFNQRMDFALPLENAIPSSGAPMTSSRCLHLDGLFDGTGGTVFLFIFYQKNGAVFGAVKVPAQGNIQLADLPLASWGMNRYFLLWIADTLMVNDSKELLKSGGFDGMSKSGSVAAVPHDAFRGHRDEGKSSVCPGTGKIHSIRLQGVKKWIYPVEIPK